MQRLAALCYGMHFHVLLSTSFHAAISVVLHTYVFTIQHSLQPSRPRCCCSGERINHVVDNRGFLAQRAYWQQQLADAPVMLELTLDSPRPPQPSGRGGAISFVLEPVQLVGMRTLAAGCGATLFMALLAAWQVICELSYNSVLRAIHLFKFADLADMLPADHACHARAGISVIYMS